jgi:hypothetical protein
MKIIFNLFVVLGIIIGMLFLIQGDMLLAVINFLISLIFINSIEILKLEEKLAKIKKS